MKEKESYQKVIEEVIQIMKDLDFSESTISKYKSVLCSFDHYYQAKNYSVEDAVISYLVEHNVNTSDLLSKNQAHMVRSLNVFLDYCFNGYFRHSGKYGNNVLKRNNKEPVYEEYLSNFINHRITEFDVSESTQKKYKKT